MFNFVLIVIAALLILDIVRSVFVLRGITKKFYQTNQDKTVDDQTFGHGKAFNLVILGDSTFDVRADAKVMFGPAQVVIDELSKHHEVHIKLLAKAGAMSYDVVREQLPVLETIDKIDLVILYMGANNAVYLRNPWRVRKDYRTLLEYTESKEIPVIASEIANYWLFRIFSWAQQIWLYIAVHVENHGIREAVAGCKYVTLISVKKLHNDIHKNRKTEPYLLDRFHPNDKTNIKWGTYMLTEAMTNQATSALFED